MTTSTVGARLDRLPVGPFHYGVFWLVGAGMSSTVVEMVLAAQERDHLGSRSSPASAGSPGSSSCSPKTIIETKTSVGMMMATRRLSDQERRPHRRVKPLTRTSPSGMDDLYVGTNVLPALLQSRFSTLDVNAVFVSITFLGMTIGALVAGFVGDRFGRRFTYQINLAIFGLASLAAAAAPDMTILNGLRFVMGLGLGAEIVVGYWRDRRVRRSPAVSRDEVEDGPIDADRLAEIAVHDGLDPKAVTHRERLVEMVLAAQERDHLGSRSSPASAGSPGSSSCSPKTIIETKTSVGMMMATRRLSDQERRPHRRVKPLTRTSPSGMGVKPLSLGE